MLTKKLHFLAPPSNLVFIGAKGSSRKSLGPVGQKWISQNSTKGTNNSRSAEGRHPCEVDIEHS